jgi:hypothetical protein
MSGASGGANCAGICRKRAEFAVGGQCKMKNEKCRDGRDIHYEGGLSSFCILHFAFCILFLLSTIICLPSAPS